MKRKFLNTLKAYSLIELSIVLVIISVLVAGAMTVSLESLKSDRQLITKEERMGKVYKMLINYLKINSALPCPASLTKIKSVDSSYGDVVDCTSASNNYIRGAVPTKALGLPAEYAEDGFGSKIIYFVDRRFTIAAVLSAPPVFGVDNFSTMANNQLAVSPPADLWTIKSNPAGTRQDVTRNAVFGMISLGENKRGAYNANSSSPNPDSLLDSDEITNYSSSGNIVISSSSASSSFDDLVFYKTMRDIISDYPEIMALVPCDNIEADYQNGTDTGDSWYEGVVYSRRGVCPSPRENTRFSKKCGPNGVFVGQATDCSIAGTSECKLTNGQDVSPLTIYTGPEQTYSNGSVIDTYISCKSGYGRKIIGGSRLTTDSAQTCGVSITDRTSASPSAVCSNGVLYIINNDCSACRGCSNNDTTSGNVSNDAYVTHSMSCNNDSRTAESIILSCRSRGVRYTLTHMASRSFGHVKERKCNCPCEDRNVCNVATLQCLDGSFSLIDEPGQSLGSSTICNSGVIQCDSSSQSCGNGC
ncbi:MAG: type II secretion system GspH family protein [Proteobacteria bacterium]|nr:type II secretion system GspH family protein [Pseudomonadota bacterium]